MPAGFLYQNRAAAATVTSAQATVATMPVGNLQDPQPRRRARLMGSVASIILDMNETSAIDCAALISTSLSPSATVRARAGSEAGIIETSPVLDLDFMAATPSSMAGWSAPRGAGGGTGEATYFNSSGVLIEAAAGEWRIDHDPATGERRGLLLEPERKNWIRNPRFNGTVAGTPGTPPTFMVVGIAAGGIFPASGSGVSLSISNVGIESGVPFIDFSVSGTPLVNGSMALFFEFGNMIPASAGQTWTCSFFHKGINIAGLGQTSIVFSENDAAGNFLSFSLAQFEVAALPAVLTRASIPAVISNTPGVAYVAPYITWAFSAGQPVSGTIRIGAPQMELGSFATSVILPPVSAPAATTRNAENGGKPFSIGSEFSIFSEIVHASMTSISSPLQFLHSFLVSKTDGSTVAELRTFKETANNLSDGYIVTFPSSVIADFYQVTPAVNAVQRQAMAYAANNMAYSANGLAVGTDSSGSIDSIARVAIWQGEAVTYLRKARIYNRRLTNAQLVALSGTGSTLVAADVLADTGTVNAQASDEGSGNVVLTFPAPVTARYLRIDIEDGAAEFMDIGLLVAGALWRVQRGVAYGAREGRVILDRRDRNPFTGAEFPVPAIANPRYCAFTLPSLSTSEARTQHRDLVRVLGAVRDGLVIPELNDSLSERNRRAIWGAINVPGEDAAVSRDSFPLSSRAFRVIERL